MAVGSLQLIAVSIVIDDGPSKALHDRITIADAEGALVFVRSIQFSWDNLYRLIVWLHDR